MEKKKRRKFDKDFMDSAVRLVESGKSAAAVARDLGLQEWMVQGWVRSAKKPAGSKSNIDLLEENKRLKKELARAQEEAAILKKAAAYFAQHQQ